MDFNQNFYTAQEAARQLRISESTLYRWLRSGKMEGFKVKYSVWRIPESSLNKFLTENSNEALRIDS